MKKFIVDNNSVKLIFSFIFVLISTLFFDIIFSSLNLFIVVCCIFLLFFLRIPKFIIYFSILCLFNLFFKYIAISYINLLFDNSIVFHRIMSIVFSSVVFLLIFCKNIKFYRLVFAFLMFILTFIFFGDFYQFETTLQILVVSTLCFFIIFSADRIIFISDGLHIISFALCWILLFSLLTNIISLDREQIKTIGILDTKWCSTKGEFGDDYSMKSAYSYSLMRDLLNNQYRTIDVYNHSGISLDLKNIDLLLILTPTYMFSNDDIEKIVNFVKSGGKLVAISDHTDLYGHARNLNKLLRIFRVQINYDSVFSPISDKVTIDFLRLNLPRMDVKTPCSISVFTFADIFGVARNSIREMADYSRANFFGELRWTADDRLGDFVVGATVPYGLGEITIFSDSTIFSNFAIFQPGNIDLLNSLFISHGYTSRIILFFVFLFIFVLIFSFRRHGFIQYMSFISSIVIILVFSTQIKFDHNFLYREKFINVYSDYSIISESADKNIINTTHLSTLYANIARSGLFPRYSGNIIPDIIDKYSLAFVAADNIDILSSIKSGHDKLKVVVYGQSEKLFKYNLSVHDYNMDVDPEIRDIFEMNMEKSFSYINSDSHNFSAYGVDCIAAHGLLDDQTLNTWWVNKDISPFKRFILSSFYRWITNSDDIGIFKYPYVGFNSCNNGKYCSRWKFKANNKSPSINATVYSENGFVYLGARRWAFLESLNDSSFLLGAPELCDSYIVGSPFNDSWGAVSNYITQ